MTELAYQKCISAACQQTFSVRQALSRCPACGNLLDVRYEWDRVGLPSSLAAFEERWADRRNPLDFSGVWRFRELLSFADPRFVVSIGEGQTPLLPAAPVARYTGVPERHLFLQYEGFNPSGSFKDNGMTAAFTHAKLCGAKRAVCASTGNTSASLAAFAAASQLLEAIIFIGSGKIAYGKLSQALDYGARTIQIEGDFDDAMQRVVEVSDKLGLYLMNSLNPFRLEGQKAIMYRVLEHLRWQVPDWVIVPGGNLGNSSAFGKAFLELAELGLIPRIPRIAIINSAGADTLFQLVERGLDWSDGAPDDALIQSYYDEMDASGIRAHTVASAIEINRPVNLKKALRTLHASGGVVRCVTDEEILDAKAQVGRAGLGCEPASAASVAGAKKLRAEGLIAETDVVVCILTGHQLKDPTATVAYHSYDADELEQQYGDFGVRRAPFGNRPRTVPNDLDRIVAALQD